MGQEYGLVRQLCTQCRKPVRAPKEELGLLKIPPEVVASITFYETPGCVHCDQTGYQGRTGIYEVIEITPGLRDLISAESAEQELRSAALAMGMLGLRESGLEKVKAGLTSISELARVIEVEEQLQTLCRKCSKPVNIDFVVCPHCATPLGLRCRSCGKANQPNWNVCPYCSCQTEHKS